VADGDALILPMEAWEPILDAAADTFVNLRQVSCYATATNILEKTDAELAQDGRPWLKVNICVSMTVMVRAA
jgi:hypothetical protein